MFRSLSLLGATAVGANLFAATSAFAVLPGHVPPPTGGPVMDICASPPSLSADGTSGTCADPNYLTTCTSEVAACQALLGPAFQKYYGARSSNVGQVVLPAALPHPVDATHNGLQGTTYDALHFLEPVPTTTASGSGATFFNQPSPAVTAGDASVHSCADYVYKKWYSYSGIDDYMRQAVGSVAQRAEYESYFFLSPFVRVDGQPIEANGTSVPSLPRGATLPRNIFLAPGMASWLSSSDPTQAAVLAGVQGVMGQPITIPNASDLEMAYGTFQLLSYIPEETLRDNENRMNAFAELLGTYGDTTAALNHNQLAVACLSPNRITQATNCPLWKADGGDAFAPQPFSAQVFASGADMRNAALSHYFATVYWSPPDPTGIPHGYAGPKPKNPLSTYQNAVTQLQASLQGVGTQLTIALVAEWNYSTSHGCLGGYYAGIAANVCDLPARYLEDHYARLFQTQREAAYDRCIADTGDDFEQLGDPARLAQTFLDPAIQHTDWHTSLTSFETFLSDYENRDALNKAFVAKEKQIQQSMLVQTSDLPVTGGLGAPQQIGQSKQDSDDKGGDWFGGGYSYGYDWHVTPTVQNASDPTSPICSLSGEAGANFSAHATVLKQNVDVVDAAFQVSSSPGEAILNQAHFTFLGESYFNADGENFTGQTFNQPIDATPIQGGFEADIPVGPFLLTVGGGASLTVGAQLTAAVVPPPQCDPTNVSWSMNASVTPSVRADAYAYVGVDLIVVKAGVEGSVELLGLQAPLTAQVKLVSDPTTGINLSVSNNASLTMTELSGKVSLYAEVDYIVGSNRAELELFSWDGFRQNVPLWQLQKNYPLNAINYRLFNHFNPADADNPTQ